MKKVLPVFSFLISIISLSLIIMVYNKSGKKIGYVESMRVINNYKGMQDAQKDIDMVQKILNSKLDSIEVDFKNEMKRFEKYSQNMTEKEKIVSNELLLNKQSQYYQYQEIVKQRSEKEEMRIKEIMLEKLNKFMKKFGEENDYTLIVGATSYGNVVYADNVIDITDHIIKSANESYGKIN